MAATLTTGTAQTVAGASLTPLFLPSASYVVSKDVAGEAILTNTAAALDQPNLARFAVSAVKDIFAQTGLSPLAGQSTEGLSILTQIQERWKVDDAADALPALYYPASCHMVLRIPNDALVTSSVVADMIRRCLGLVLRDNDDTLAQGWNNLIHSICRF